jgi:hypothetical protein
VGAVVVVTLVAATYSTSAAEAPRAVAIATKTSKTRTTVPVKRAETCSDAQRAVTYYRRSYAAHRAAQRLSGPVPRVWYHDCDAVRRRAAMWAERSKLEREAAIAWREYHYDWWKWLPANWYRVGSCETGYGGAPNFAHSVPGFVSAFGITRTNYATDARWAGGPQWSDDPEKRPTPRQQYQAALAHYQHHGDGWGCPGP